MILLRVQKSNRHYLVNIRKTDFGKFRGYSKNHQFWHSKWWHLFLSAADLVWTDDHYDCLVVQQKLMIIDIPSRAGSHIPTGKGWKSSTHNLPSCCQSWWDLLVPKKGILHPRDLPPTIFCKGWILIIPLNPGCLIWILVVVYHIIPRNFQRTR